LEVLHAGRLDPPPSPDLTGLQRVLSLARDQYDAICADLPSSVDPFTTAIMQESQRIFLVTTPEVVPLYLAASRLRRLTDLGLANRVSLLLNRKIKTGLSDNEVAEAVGVPVSYTFSNEYATVRSAILEASPVSQDSPLGQNILTLARSLAPEGDRKPPSRGSKFLEFFHVPHTSELERV
jgi:pilus assembly protein CpaE